MKVIRQVSGSLAWLSAVFLSLSVSAQTVPQGTITYIHNDLLGSPAAATNAAGVVIWREAYSGYGERLKNQPAGDENKVWYTSRHQDEDTGLVYMGARYYDPALGRFLSVDSMGFSQGNVHSFNRYAYANNNPYRFKDPDGNSPEDFLPKDAPLLAIGRAIGGVAAFGIGAANGDGALMAASSAGLAESRQQNIDVLLLLATMQRGGKGPTEAGGAKLANISPAEALRIQNAANRTGTEISVVGSRASGTNGPNSDWDYVIPTGASKSTEHSLKSSLPEGPRGLGEPRNVDILRGTVDAGKPNITFRPEKQ